MHTLRICRMLALDSMARSASQGVYKVDFGQRWVGSWSTILWWERMSGSDLRETPVHCHLSLSLVSVWEALEVCAWVGGEVLGWM